MIYAVVMALSIFTALFFSFACASVCLPAGPIQNTTIKKYVTMIHKNFMLLFCFSSLCSPPSVAAMGDVIHHSSAPWQPWQKSAIVTTAPS
jgi:hypothetical protein